MSKSKRGHSLNEIQSFVWEAIRRPLTSRFHMKKRWQAGIGMAAKAQQFVLAGQTLGSFARLEIYNQQYWYRMLDCFEEDFPGLRAVLGERRFRTLAYEYVSAHPSNSFSLRDLGAQLPSFLERRTELVAPHTVLCLELARFEWAQVVAFDEAQLEPFSMEQLQEATAVLLRFKLQPYMTLLHLTHALDEYSTALRKHESDRSEAGSGPPKSAKQRRNAPRPCREEIYLVVHRHENSVYFKRLEAPAFVLLSSLSEGMTLGESVSITLTYCEEQMIEKITAAKVNDWFASWMRLNWLCPSEPD